MLKAAIGAFVLLACLPAARPADATTLVTGAIRDQSGTAIGGAHVTALDGSGRTVGADVTIDDGTFALDVTLSAVTVTVACDYCRSVTRKLDFARAPLVVIVERFSTLTQGEPSVADIRALPYRSAADIASLRPFAVDAGGRISDRGLDVYAATLVNGLPLYSPADGDTYIRLIPAHALAALGASSPLVAPTYGGYAAAGVDDLRLSDVNVATSRLDAGGGTDTLVRVQTPNAEVVYGQSGGDGNRRAAGAADVALPFAGGRLSVDALDMTDTTAAVSGLGFGYVTDSRRYSSAASLRATQTADASLMTVDAHVRNHGPIALEFGLRAARATSAAAGQGAGQADDALYADATQTSGAHTLTAALAVDRGSDSGSASVHAAAVVGSFGNDVQLTTHWSVHSGVVSNLRIPTFAEIPAIADGNVAAERSLLFEQSATYADLRRIRITGIGYTQRTTGVLTSHINGIGIDMRWQVAPDLALRTWLLRANQAAGPAAVFDPPYSYGIGTSAKPVTRQLAWLTYDRSVRLDLLLRGGALEGDIRVPLGSAFALALGTATYNASRFTTLGITLR